jgi:hypothetical protein
MNEEKIPLLENLPYTNTQVAMETTQGNITELLVKYNVESYQWTFYKGQTVLKFMFDNKPFMLIIPKIQAKKINRRFKTSEIIEVDQKITARIFYWSLKSILEIASCNMEGFRLDQLLLGQQIIRKDNKLISVSEVLQENPDFLLGDADQFFLGEG